MPRLAAIPGITFALVLVWKVGLLLFTTQPVPANDAFFYDGPVVNFLLHGKYCNPSLALVLPISGTEVFCAYPPLYQVVLLGWMSVFGTSVLAAMWLHVVLFGLYQLVLLAIFRRLQIPAWCVNLAGLFLFSITFHDRPDSVAHLLGMLAVYAWVRGWGVDLRIGVIREFPANAPNRSSALPSSAPWLVAVLLLLTFCTSLQIGGIYFLWLGALICGAVLFGQTKFPWAATGAWVGALAGLIALVKFGFPHFWAGFLEHARMTPTVAGWRVPQISELIKIGRTVPGILAVGGIFVLLAAQRKIWCECMAKSPGGLLAITGTLVAGVVVGGSLLILSANSIMIANYLQPIVVGCFLAALAGGLSAIRTRNLLIAGFVAAALLASVRAIGLTTWGVACARDVSYAQALSQVRAELASVPDGKTVLVSSAFLYETAQRTNITWIHSDWPAVWSPAHQETEALLKIKPAKMILTQFDYYRHHQPLLAELETCPEVKEVRVTNTASIPVPDANVALQKVVQHLSWAPVVVDISWR